MNASDWLGIDFGTSNSSAARLVGGHPHPVREPLEHQPFFPSCVLLRPPAGALDTSVSARIVTGVAAQRTMLVYPERFRAEIKRSLGTPWPFLLGSEELPVVDAVAAVLRALKDEADRSERAPGAIVTVPVAFGAERVASIERAAELAGFTDVRTYFEPEAAARYHVYASSAGDAGDELLLVYDFGGGTFDASLVRRSGSEFSVLASAGLDDCGGGDIDRLLYEAVRERASPALQARLEAADSAGFDDTMSEDELQGLLRLRLNAFDRIRRMKHDLSLLDASEADFGTPPEVIAYRRSDFEALVAAPIERTLACCDGLVRGRSLEWKDVTRVLLVGGTTRIPAIATALRERFGRPVSAVSDPELAVSFGAALAVGALAREDRALDATAVSAPALPEPVAFAVPLNAGSPSPLVAAASPAAAAATATATATAMFVTPSLPPVGGSLQSRLDAAAAGETLVIEAGTYRESLRVTKPVTLSGDVAGGSILIGEADAALIAASDGVSLSHLTLQTVGGDYALRIEGGSFTARQCAVSGGSKGAASVTACAALDVRESRFHDSGGAGLAVFAGVGGTVAANRFEDHGAAGIFIVGIGERLSIAKNESLRNKVGICVASGAHEIEISDNVVEHNDVGMSFYERSAPLVRGNTIRESGTAAMLLERGARATIERNEIFGSILIRGADTAPLIRDNAIAADGIAVDGISAGGLLIDNRISGTDGVVLAGKEPTTMNVRGNEIKASRRAVVIEGRGGATIEHNRITCSASSAVGVRVDGPAAATIEQNRFEGAFVFFQLPGHAGLESFQNRWKVADNTMRLRPLASGDLQQLAGALERSSWLEADAESLRLLRAAAGTTVITTEAAARIPLELLAQIAGLWRLAGPPYETRPGIAKPEASMTARALNLRSAVYNRLSDLKLLERQTAAPAKTS